MTIPLLQPQPHLSGDPSPAAIIPPALLADLTSPALSLTDVASRHNLSLSQLSVYISHPAVSNHLASLHILAIEHVRFIASLHVTQAIGVLNQVLKRGSADHDAAEPALPVAPAEPATPKSPALLVRASAIRARRLETLRRAATTVLQITRLNPPVFNYARAHAHLEHTLPPEPAHIPLQPTPQAAPAPSPSPAFETPIFEPPAPELELEAEAEAADFPSTPPLKSEISNSETLTPSPFDFQTIDDPDLVTSGSPHEHWP